MGWRFNNSGWRLTDGSWCVTRKGGGESKGKNRGGNLPRSRGGGGGGPIQLRKLRGNCGNIAEKLRCCDQTKLNLPKPQGATILHRSLRMLKPRGGATPRFWTPTTPPTNCWPEAPWGGGGGGRGSWRPRTRGVAPPVVETVSELRRQAALNITMNLKYNSLFWGQENVEAYCSATVVCKGQQQARKVDRPEAIAEKLRKMAEN